MSTQREQKEIPEVTFMRFSFLQYISWRDFGAEFYSYSLKGDNYLSRRSGVEIIDWFELNKLIVTERRVESKSVAAISFTISPQISWVKL